MFNVTNSSYNYGNFREVNEVLNYYGNMTFADIQRPT